ncbi:MAG: helix-turn-helix domain-containing protein [Gilvibacter sp.]
MLSLLTLLFGVHIFLFLYGTSSLEVIYPRFSGWFYFEVSFLFGPLLFVYFECLLFDKQKLAWRDALHLIPIIVYWVFYADVLLLEGVSRLEYVYQNFNTRTMIWNYSLAGQLCLYGIVLLYLLYRYKKHLTAKHYTYAILLLGVYATSTAVITYLTEFAQGWRDFAYYYLVNNLFILAVGIILYKDPQFIKQIRKKYLSSALSEEDMQSIKQKIEVAFGQESVYLKNNLTIDHLSAILDERSYHISQTFSSFLHENFNDYVNRHRIAHAKNLLLNPKYAHYKIEAIALESGFNNKVTFYKAFTKFVDDTPTGFKRKSSVKK